MSDVDRVQKRPAMYLGDTADGSGLHSMVYEVVSNAIAESLGGHADRIDVVLNSDGSCSVCDNGRGMPTEIDESEGISAAEIIMTRIVPFGTCEQEIYEASGRRQGVGVFVVNALSDWLELTIWRGGKEHFIRFRRGVREAPLAVTGNARIRNGQFRRGTEVTFLPSTKFFANTTFDVAALERKLRELAFHNAGANILLSDRR